MNKDFTEGIMKRTLMVLALLACSIIMIFLINIETAAAAPFDILSQNYSVSGLVVDEFYYNNFNISSDSPIRYKVPGWINAIADGGYSGSDSLFVQATASVPTSIGHATAYSSLEFRPNNVYRVDIKLNQCNVSGLEAFGSADLFINGESAVTFSLWELDDHINNVINHTADFQDYTLRMIVDPSKTYTLRVSAIDSNDPAWAGIKVDMVPEPAMMLLFGSGLAGIGFLRKRFKS